MVKFINRPFINGELVIVEDSLVPHSPCVLKYSRQTPLNISKFWRLVIIHIAAANTDLNINNKKMIVISIVCFEKKMKHVSIKTQETAKQFGMDRLSVSVLINHLLVKENSELKTTH